MSTKLEPVSIGPFKSGDTMEHTLDTLDDLDIAVSLNGATIEYQIARRIGATSVISLSSSDSPATIAINNNTDSPPVANQVVATIDKALTEALEGTYYWECEATDVTGQTATIGYGRITFKRDHIP